MYGSGASSSAAAVLGPRSTPPPQPAPILRILMEVAGMLLGPPRRFPCGTAASRLLGACLPDTDLPSATLRRKAFIWHSPGHSPECSPFPLNPCTPHLAKTCVSVIVQTTGTGKDASTATLIWFAWVLQIGAPPASLGADGTAFTSVTLVAVCSSGSYAPAHAVYPFATHQHVAMCCTAEAQIVRMVSQTLFTVCFIPSAPLD
eukprot:gene3934-4300_t